MSVPLIYEIQQKGYWQVVIRPNEYREDRVPTLEQCRSLLSEIQVRLRGWYFPHIKDADLVNKESWVECSTSWHLIREHWRFYQSGQFFHLSGCVEDYADQSDLGRKARFVSNVQNSSELRYLDILPVIYRFTEIFVLASRMVEKGLLEQGGSVSIGLYGAQDRLLTFYDPARHLSMPYISKNQAIEYAKEYEADRLLTGGKELALDATKYFFERFNWAHMPIPVFQDEQEKLLRGAV